MGGIAFFIPKLLVVLLRFGNVFAGGYSLDWFTPAWGSYNGGTPMRLHGAFTINPFNSGVGREIPEIKVYFIGEYQVFEADVEKDSTKEHVIGCYTRPMPGGEYEICVEIEGEQYCKSTYYVVWWRTPRIASFYFTDGHGSFAGPPQSLLTVEGRIFTQLYGTNNIQMLETGEELTIRRAYAGPEDCAFTDENDELYGLELNSEGSWDGQFTCKMNSDYVGNNNFTFIVTSYGRSSIDSDLMRVTGNDKIYMFQTYAEVTNISPQSGSTQGGTVVTVTGKHFDPNPTKSTYVWIGRQPCQIIEGSQTNTELKCTTPPEPSVIAFYPGSRGVIFEAWYDTSMDLDEARVTLNSSHPGYETWEADSAGYVFPNETTIVKVTGMFEVPVDDRYQFYIKSDDESVLYLSCDGNASNAEKVAYGGSYYSSYIHSSTQRSGWMELEKGQLCYFDGLVMNRGGPGNIYVAVQRATTTLTSAQSSNVLMEKQQIRWLANEKKEKQIVSLIDWEPQSPESEVQTVEVISDCFESDFPETACENAFYMLSYRGRHTQLLTVKAMAFEVQEALNKIMPTDDVDVSVTSTVMLGGGGQQTGNSYEVSFSGYMGDEPMLMLEQASTNVTVNILETTKGRPNFLKFSLNFLGRITNAIPADGSAEDVEDALLEAREAKCVDELMNLSPLFINEFLHYEGERPRGFVESGKRIKDMEAFCGRYSLRNPYHVFQHDREHFSKYKVEDFPHFCFAHKGMFINRLRIQFQYTRPSDKKKFYPHIDLFEGEIVMHENEWSYSCFDLENAIKSDVNYADVEDIQILRLAGFEPISNREYFYIDEVLTTKKQPDDLEDVVTRRQRPAMHQGEVISSIEVEKLESNQTEFLIKYYPYNCAHDLPLLSVVNAREVISLSADHSQQTGMEWPRNILVNVTRTQRTNIPVEGTFDISYDDDELGLLSYSGIPAQVTYDEFKAILHSMGLEEMLVTGWRDYCYSRRLFVQWVTNGGDKKMFNVDGTNMSGEDDLTFGHYLQNDGGVMHAPIGGDMLRYMYDDPQVEVVMNGIYSYCDGDCSFTYSDALTPILTSISPTFGNNRTSVTITGTNLDEASSGSQVLIGGVECAITSHTTTEIVCTTGTMEYGDHDVIVQVGGKGYGKQPDPALVYTQFYSVSTISPSTSFTTGGITLTLTGAGLSSSLSVEINSIDCPVISSTPMEIQCVVPPSSTEASFLVELVTDQGFRTGVDTFTYSNAGMPIVTSITGENIMGPGGTSVLLSGSNFGTTIEDVTVTIGGESCEIINLSDTSIECTSPFLSNGTYTLEVLLAGLGAANLESNSIPDIVYTFVVTDIQPRIFSLFGGQVMEITGNGFIEGTSVTLGDIECEVNNTLTTSIFCTLGSTGETHFIYNDGSHPDYGEGYAWSPSVITIKQGDTVIWDWDLPPFISDVDGIKIFETDQPDGILSNGGFISGEVRSLSGFFAHTFTSVGTFYYSSGFVDDEDFGVILMSGTVYVEPLSDISLKLKVESNEIEAEIDLIEENTIVKRAATCEPLNTGIDGCSTSRKKRDTGTSILSRAKRGVSSIIPITEDYKTQFLHSHNDVRSKASPSGSNIILMQWDEDVAASAQAWAEECTWGHSTDASRSHGTYGQLGENIAIYSRGNQLDNIANDGVALWASEVAYYNYSTLSCNDTKVCGHYTQIVWDDSYALGCAIMDCDEADIENDPFPTHDGAYYIVCQYGPGGNFNQDTNPPYDEGAPCSNCPANFPVCDSTYSLCSADDDTDDSDEGGDVTASVCFTPTITSISPLFGTVEETITIEGTGFGDDSCRLTVTIGDDIPCTVTASTSTNITCNPNPNAGASIGIAHEVTVNVLGYGDAFVEIPADADRRFALLPSISSITPTSGSLAGGTYIDIIGVGFMDGGTMVNIGGTECEIISHDYVNIRCKTSSESQGSQTLGVTVDSFSAVCLNSCDFTFDVTVTPSVTSISPTVVATSNTNIQIIGTGFDGMTVTVMIGDTPCSVGSSNDTFIECLVTELMAGDFETKIHVDPDGYANFVGSNIVTGASTAVLTTASGSVFGGNVIGFMGHGFNSDGLQVTFGGAEAEIITKTNAIIVLKTPPGSAGAQDVIIVSNDVTYPTLQFTYDSAATPAVSDISPMSGGVGITITITGTMLNETSSTNEVWIGDAACTITSENATEIQCTTGEPSVGGVKDITVFIGGRGNADTTGITFTYDMEITSFFPTEGSFGGGNEITIIGSGFSSDAMVHVGYSSCVVNTVVYGNIVCTLEETPSLVSRDDAIESVEIVLNGQDITFFNSLPRDDYTVLAQFASNCKDCDSLIDDLPTHKIGSGDALVSPTGFNQVLRDVASDISVWEPVPPSDAYVCLGNILVQGSSSPALDSIACVHYLLVEESTATLELDATDLYLWNIDGSPFATYTDSSTAPTVYKLKDLTQALADSDYPVMVDNDGTDVMSSSNYTFKSTLTPVVTNVSPTRGGTGGGTPIIITGTGFSLTKEDVSVTIGGIVCDVTSSTLTTIECTTNSRNNSIETAVIVDVVGKGQSLDVGVKFYYIDRWSSIWTWGGRGIPTDDTFVVIPHGMEIMIDNDTAILKMLLIQGKVFFDDADIELHAKNILIDGGGVLQIGTEDEPFQHKGIITLHGHLRSIELPIYGTKTLAVRDGMLDLHGKYVPVSWTYLSSTAAAGSSVIVVDNPVTWEAGDEIVIASSGYRHSQEENEKRTIASVNGDQVTITLTSPLDFEHLGVTETLPDGTVISSRAEVGLLTHNVVVRGSRNMDWSEVIPACPDGFNTGEFAQQTCFQGRFGEEMGADQFGGQIMFHHPSPDEQKAFGRISYVELNYMGQAFRLGRYAIHYHLMGDMNYKNYVRGCSIHETFNRAVTIHDTHKALVERNVVFNSMGGSIFIEDGLETGNVIRGNLVVFCRQSTSLQNDDITPAAFWITNADNIVEDNAAAGGTHFGYWFRMHKHPSGPSHTNQICPRKVELSKFSNNTAHSQGWFGIWIFQEFTPKVGSCCNCNQNKLAVLEGLEIWRCEKGVEFVQTGSVAVNNSKLHDNEKAGIEVKMTKPLVWGESGIWNSVIVGHSSVSLPNEQSRSAIVLPYSDGFLASNIAFINFDRAGGAILSTTTIDGTCADHCGGFHSKFEGITHHNTNNLGIFRWEHENFIEDMDGSLTKTGVPSTVIAKTDTAPPSCIEKAEWSVGNYPGMVCPELRLHRIAWNNAIPTSLDGSLVNLTNQYGRTQVPFEKKRMTHKPGWMALLFDGETYDWVYHHLPKMANVTYDATYYNYQPNDCTIMRHQFTQTPDMFSVAEGQVKNSTMASLDCSTSDHGDYYFDDATKLMEYIVTGDKSTRKKRALDEGDYWADPTALNRDIEMNTFRCFYKDCIPPPDPNTIPPARERPEDYDVWSDTSIWEDNTLPVDNSDVTIETGKWVVADIDLPIFGTLWLEGVLELDWEPNESGDYKNFTIQATYIFIRGGRLIIGWEDNLFRGLANIILTGDRDADDFAIVQGVNMGAKAIGVFGGLDMHGITTTTSWTRLSQTVTAGSSAITLAKAVDWKVGDDILLATTSYDPWETETFKIDGISVDMMTLMLNTTVKYDHIVETYSYDNGDIKIEAEVGLLSRNIKVIGNEYPGSDEESFGGRIIVGQYFQEGIEYRGYARIEDVEFLRMGQEGYSDSSDPRYSLVYWKSGTSDLIKPSYVKRCSFTRNFNTAIGVFLASGIVFEDNVVYHTVGSSVIIEGSDNRFSDNLVTLMINPGTYRDKNNAIWYWFGAVQTDGSSSVYLGGNVVAGSERAGYWTGGEPCSNPSWGSNTARATLQGVYVNKNGQVGCTTIRNFNIHHSYDYGIYFQDRSDVEIDSCVVTDSSIGILTLLNGPSATSHTYEDKYVLIKDSTIVANTKPGVCASSLDTALDYLVTSPNFRPPRTVDGSNVNIGLFGSSFMSGHNACTKKPCAGLMQYPGLGGEVIVRDTTFINFDDTSCGIDNIVFMMNKKNEDYQHPIFFSGISFQNTSSANKIYYPRPSLGKINPADCVDMECDGMKNMILHDTDGSFLEAAPGGTVISQAEFEWDGEPARGLGDSRIPKTLLTRLNGSRIPVEEIAPNKGILRANVGGKTCVYQSDWQAYECHGYNHKLFIIESLDWDSETRRISPVALLSEGYIDLVNGPQDHGWCAGYTCQLRLSTFYTTVAIDYKYEIHFSGSNPQELRLKLPHAESDEAIVACLYYSTSNRLDVYTGGSYVLPKNGYYEGAKVLTRRPPANDTDFYMPTTSDPTGTNYYSRAEQTICITIRGSDHVDIKISNAVYLSFGVPSVTTDEFFDDLINNLALLLNVPAEDIWIVDIVRENSNRRKKRGVPETSTVVLGIGPPPSPDPPKVKEVPRSEVDENGTIIDPGTASNDTIQAIAEETEAVNELNEIVSIITNAAQLGTLSDALGVNITEPAITKPLPSSTDDSWEEVAIELEESGGTLEPERTIVLDQMMIVTQPGPNLMRAGEAFKTQPMLKFLDTDGNLVSQPGTEENPWEVTARFYNGTNNGATLIGETKAIFNGSYAEFEDLGIDIEGEYEIEFYITYPEQEPPAFSVSANPITLRTPRDATNCTDEEGEDKFDKEYVYEGNCSSLCLFDCEGENEQCADLLTCGPHSECIGFECMCKEEFGFDEHDPDNLEQLLNPEIYCMPDHMELRLDKCGLNAIGFRLDNLFIFGDGPVETVFHQSYAFDSEIQRLDLTHDCNTCRGEVSVTSDGIAYSFTIAENFTDCNADVVENATHIMYKNMIRGSRASGDGMILRDRPIEVQFTCNYIRTLWKTLDTVIHPFISKINLTVESEGSFDIVMGIWKDSQYLELAEAPINVHVPDSIYVAVLADGVNDAVLYIDECHATASDDPDDDDYYDLVVDGCASGPDVTVAKNGINNEDLFSFESFVFADHPDNTTMFLHCQVVVCVHDKTECTPNCGLARKRRDNGNKVKKLISLGPITVTNDVEDGIVRSKRNVEDVRYAAAIHDQISSDEPVISTSGFGSVRVKRSLNEDSD